jgi:hypothetical protein
VRNRWRLGSIRAAHRCAADGVDRGAGVVGGGAVRVPAGTAHAHAADAVRGRVADDGSAGPDGEPHDSAASPDGEPDRNAKPDGEPDCAAELDAHARARRFPHDPDAYASSDADGHAFASPDADAHSDVDLGPGRGGHLVLVLVVAVVAARVVGRPGRGGAVRVVAPEPQSHEGLG